MQEGYTVVIEPVSNGYIMKVTYGEGLCPRTNRYVCNSIFELLNAINTFLNPDSSEKRDLIEKGLGGIKFAYDNLIVTVPEEKKNYNRQSDCSPGDEKCQQRQPCYNCDKENK